MSWGGTVQQTAQNLAEPAVMPPRGSQLHNDITHALGRRTSSGGQVEAAAPGVAALMLHANPRLTTSHIQEILQSSARNLPGDRDGAGIIDPVAAVRRARELAAAR